MLCTRQGLQCLLARRHRDAVHGQHDLTFATESVPGTVGKDPRQLNQAMGARGGEVDTGVAVAGRSDDGPTKRTGTSGSDRQRDRRSGVFNAGHGLRLGGNGLPVNRQAQQTCFHFSVSQWTRGRDLADDYLVFAVRRILKGNANEAIRRFKDGNEVNLWYWKWIRQSSHGDVAGRFVRSRRESRIECEA